MKKNRPGTIGRKRVSEFNLTKERIRQLQDKALRMLRHPSRSQYLRHVLLGERLRNRLFTEINNSLAYPPIFLMWEEDYELLLSLKKSLEQAAKRKQSKDNIQQVDQNLRAGEKKTGHVDKPPESQKNESLYNVQQGFPFQDL